MDNKDTSHNRDSIMHDKDNGTKRATIAVIRATSPEIAHGNEAKTNGDMFGDEEDFQEDGDILKMVMVIQTKIITHRIITHAYSTEVGKEIAVTPEDGEITNPKIILLTKIEVTRIKDIPIFTVILRQTRSCALHFIPRTKIFRTGFL